MAQKFWIYFFSNQHQLIHCYLIPKEMGWACGGYGWGEGVYTILLGKLEERRPMGRPRRRWVDNIRTDLQEVGCGYIDWIGLAKERDRWRTLVSAVMNFRIPWNAGNFLTSSKPVRFSRTLHQGISKLSSTSRKSFYRLYRIVFLVYTPLPPLKPHAFNFYRSIRIVTAQRFHLRIWSLNTFADSLPTRHERLLK